MPADVLASRFVGAHHDQGSVKGSVALPGLRTRNLCPFATIAGPRNLTAPAIEDTQGGKLSAGEQKFVENAHARGLFAIGAGQVAFQSSSIREVRLLAAHTLAQQAGVEEKLAALAKTKGMAALTEELDASSRETLETLQQESGDDDFELRYSGMVVASYLREIRAFQAQADDASDPDLRELAAEVVADLKQHLAVALVIQHALASALNEAPAMITVSHQPDRVPTMIGA